MWILAKYQEPKQCKASIVEEQNNATIKKNLKQIAKTYKRSENIAKFNSISSIIEIDNTLTRKEYE